MRGASQPGRGPSEDPRFEQLGLLGFRFGFRVEGPIQSQGSERLVGWESGFQIPTKATGYMLGC